jgi:hypothetical protein
MAWLNDKKMTVSIGTGFRKSVAYLESQYRRKLLIFNLKPALGFRTGDLLITNQLLYRLRNAGWLRGSNKEISNLNKVWENGASAQWPKVPEH